MDTLMRDIPVVFREFARIFDPMVGKWDGDAIDRRATAAGQQGAFAGLISRVVLGPDYQFKKDDMPQIAEECPLGDDCKETLTFCDICMDSGAAGNIMYGFLMSFIVDFDESILYAKVASAGRNTWEVAQIRAGDTAGRGYAEKFQVPTKRSIRGEPPGGAFTSERVKGAICHEVRKSLEEYRKVVAAGRGGDIGLQKLFGVGERSLCPACGRAGRPKRAK